MGDETGVAFPTSSTSQTGRDALAAALETVDFPAADAVRRETDWRRGYARHFRHAIVAGLHDPDSAMAIARSGLEHLHGSFEYVDASGERMPLDLATLESVPRTTLSTRTIEGTAEPETELSVPYRGERLRGEALLRQVDAWVTRGVMTAACGEALHQVADHPEWLRLEGDTVVVLGAGAEMAPTRALARWGAQIAALDLPQAKVQDTIEQIAVGGAGSMLLPSRTDDEAGAATGGDVLHELAEIAEWLRGLPGRPVLGSYCYADGSAHVRVAMAGDLLAEDLVAQRPETALAFLATPTDVFAVDKAEQIESETRYSRKSRTRLVRQTARMASGGRLLQRNYAPGIYPGVCDALVMQQGPNYALAKRIHRWRAAVARDAGQVVSLNVAPATRTHSVVKNRALAAAYAGAHRFGVEVFEPGTSNTIMAALLVHDLRSTPRRQLHPWQDEAHSAVHGGLWTSAYAPRSALGLAALMGLTGLRT